MRNSSKGYIYKELLKNGVVYTERTPAHITAIALGRGLNVKTERVVCVSNKTLSASKITKVTLN